jgi:hypothetical protein
MATENSASPEQAELRRRAERLIALKKRWDAAFPVVGRRIGFHHEAEEALCELGDLFDAAARLALPPEDIAALPYKPAALPGATDGAQNTERVT